MFSNINSAGIRGMDGYLVSVETDISNGLPGFHMVGYLGRQVKEAQDRVRTALKNSEFIFPPKRITVNLSPADIRKEGTGFDFPIAVGVLAASGRINTKDLESSVLVGELGLNGELKPVSGILPMIIAAKELGMKRCFLPWGNKKEAMLVSGIQVIGVGYLNEMLQISETMNKMQKNVDLEECLIKEEVYAVDFSEINGHLFLRRATEVAVAGMHNILLAGPPGTGKTMIAQRIPSIMPPLSREEMINISKIYSVCGLISQENPLIGSRPFRSPHHTISPQAMVGGGKIPRPGEISLASGGVLFLDEFQSFKKNIIEILRQPMEEHKIYLSRVYGNYVFPSEFMLVAAINPCSCGFYPDRSKCSCSEFEVRQHLRKLSRPLLDRIDICVESSVLSYEELKGNNKNNENSESIRNRIKQVMEIQEKRFRGKSIRFNHAMGKTELVEFCSLGIMEEDYLKNIFKTMSLSARAYEKILKVARTIADLEGEETIKTNHLAEAAGYRSFSERYQRRIDDNG